MARIKKMDFSNVKDAVGKEATGGTFYDGPPPPYKVPLRGIVKRVTIGAIKSGPNKGAPRINMLVEVKEPKGSKNAKYNEFGVWHGLNITDQGAGYVNQWLNSLAGPSEVAQKKLQKAFWGAGGVKVDGDDHLIAIGTFKINSPTGTSPVAFVGKRGTDQDGEERFEIGSFLILTNSSEADEEDEEEFEDDEDEDEDYDEDDDADDEDDDVDDDEDDEDADEEDDDDGDDGEDDEDSDEDDEDDEEDDDDEDEDDEDDDDDEAEEEEDDEEEEEPAPAPKKRVARKRAPAKKGKEMF